MHPGARLAHSKNPLLPQTAPCKLTGIIAAVLGPYDTSNGYVKRYIVSILFLIILIIKY